MGDEFLDFFDTMHTTNMSIDASIRPVRAHITTMTLYGKLDGDIKFLMSMKDRHMPGSNRAKCCRLVELAESSEFFNMTPSQFSKTALQMKAKTLSASIKIFHKGSFQITGIKSQPELMWVLDEACRLISSVDASTGVTVESFETAMINVSVATTTGFNLENLLNIANGMDDTFAEMPERPPSCNVNIPVGDGKRVTSMIYKSGKIIMSGGTPSRLGRAYHTLMTTMHANLRDVTIPRSADALRRATTRFHWTELISSAPSGLTHTHGPCKTRRVEGCEYCRVFGNAFATE